MTVRPDRLFCLTCNLQLATCNSLFYQHPVSIIQHPVRNLQPATVFLSRNLQRLFKPETSIQHPVGNLQLATRNSLFNQHQASSIQHPASRAGAEQH
jgi:hypothetical protein